MSKRCCIRREENGQLGKVFFVGDGGISFLSETFKSHIEFLRVIGERLV
jgi:hypothetical protein